MRLQVYLAKAGVASRRRSEELIRRGEVKVNGAVVTEMGVQVDPSRDKVFVKGCRLHLSETKMLIALNKPVGVISTMRRGKERGKTLSDLADWPTRSACQGEARAGRLFPIGRLDKDSEGLILLTNDGELALRLSHPRFEHEKEYEVSLTAQPTPEQLERLRRPFAISGQLTQSADVKILRPKQLRLILKEGKKRQIREMCREVMLTIVTLRRVRIGPYRLGQLAPGQWKELSSQ